MQKMKAVLVKEPGDANQLFLGEYEKPVAGDNEVLVNVKAAALNRADILQRMGKYPPPPGASKILGLELAGVVESAGKSVFRWKNGDRVFGLLPGGGYAQYAVLHEDMAMKIPDSMSFTEAAAVPEVFLTAFQSIFWLAGLQPMEYILIHAGASGVGTAAIQLAREIGAKIIVTASAAKHSVCKQLGADHTIDYKSTSFKEEVLNITNGYGADVIIDFIGGPYFSDNLASLTRDGRLIMLATLGSGKTSDVDVRQILAKRLKIIGSTLRSRSLDYQIKLTNDFKEVGYDKLNKGIIKPVIDSVFDWKDVAIAHTKMEENKNTGKIVLEISA